MQKTVTPVPLRGVVELPSSKSMAHRAILAAALARGESVIENVSLSRDVEATLMAVQKLGAKTRFQDGTLRVRGVERPADMPVIDCNESGTTLRLLIPVLSALCGGVLHGRGRLPRRPLDAYLDLFDAQGVSYERAQEGLPLIVHPGLSSGRFEVPGGVSSQFISGLLFALPLLSGPSDILVTDTLESAGYVDMTLAALRLFGVEAEEKSPRRHYHIEGPQRYKPAACVVEGDWSQAAFFLLAGAVGGDIVLRGLRADSAQPDRQFLSVMMRMGADIRREGDIVRVGKSVLAAVEADVSQMIDCAPALAGAMAVAGGKSVMSGGRRLRQKESDRIAAVAGALHSIGARVFPTEDGMVIEGVERLSGGEADCYADHRIAMMLCALAPACENPVVIRNAQAVDKSYPAFFKDIKNLGGLLT